MRSLPSARELEVRRRVRARGARAPRVRPSASVSFIPRRPPPLRARGVDVLPRRQARVRDAGRTWPRGGLRAPDRRAGDVAQATRRGLQRPRAVRSRPRDGRRGSGDEGPEARGRRVFPAAVRRRSPRRRRGSRWRNRSRRGTDIDARRDVRRPARHNHLRGDGPARPAGTAREGVGGFRTRHAHGLRSRFAFRTRSDAQTGRRAGERPRVPPARLRHFFARARAPVPERAGDEGEENVARVHAGPEEEARRVLGAVGERHRRDGR